MGWGNCGTDSKDRPIGYMHDATCDYPGCGEKINRGIAYACGRMHGGDDEMGSCEKYFCPKHHVDVTHSVHGDSYTVCQKCHDEGIKNGTFIEEQANDR